MGVAARLSVRLNSASPLNEVKTEIKLSCDVTNLNVLYMEMQLMCCSESLNLDRLARLEPVSAVIAPTSR